MISPTAIGALAIAIPTIFIAYVAFFWRRRPIFWFVVALLAVGLGYLGTDRRPARDRRHGRGARQR